MLKLVSLGSSSNYTKILHVAWLSCHMANVET